MCVFVVCAEKPPNLSVNLEIFQRKISRNTPYNQRKKLPRKDQQDL